MAVAFEPLPGHGGFLAGFCTAYYFLALLVLLAFHFVLFLLLVCDLLCTVKLWGIWVFDLRI